VHSSLRAIAGKILKAQDELGIDQSGFSKGSLLGKVFKGTGHASISENSRIIGEVLIIVRFHLRFFNATSQS
jgi:hypothetical protein